ncbi:unnamed protein product [Auanema sp. JU1783]|nr:unnamed protein product [Auanema sp. JU1783]
MFVPYYGYPIYNSQLHPISNGQHHQAAMMNRWPSLPVLQNPYILPTAPALATTHHYVSPSPTFDLNNFVIPNQYSCYQQWTNSSNPQNSLCSMDSGVDLNQTDPTLPDDISLDFSFSSFGKDTEPHGDIYSVRTSPISLPDEDDHLNTAFDEGSKNESLSGMECDYDEDELLEILYMNGCPRNLAKSRCRSV